MDPLSRGLPIGLRQGRRPGATRRSREEALTTSWPEDHDYASSDYAPPQRHRRGEPVHRVQSNDPEFGIKVSLSSDSEQDLEVDVETPDPPVPGPSGTGRAMTAAETLRSLRRVRPTKTSGRAPQCSLAVSTTAAETEVPQVWSPAPPEPPRMAVEDATPPVFWPQAADQTLTLVPEVTSPPQASPAVFQGVEEQLITLDEDTLANLLAQCESLRPLAPLPPPVSAASRGLPEWQRHI